MKSLVKTLKLKRKIFAAGKAEGHALASNKIVDIETPPPAYNLKVEYWFEQPSNYWRAKIIWTETRQGKQYGGASVEEVTYKERAWRGSHARFMAKVRRHVTKQINTYWI